MGSIGDSGQSFPLDVQSCSADAHFIDACKGVFGVIVKGVSSSESSRHGTITDPESVFSNITASEQTIGDVSDIARCGSSVRSNVPPSSPSSAKAALAAATTVAGSDGPAFTSVFSAELAIPVPVDETDAPAEEKEFLRPPDS